MNKFQLGISNIRYQIFIAKDRDYWCALMGTNLQDGISGFGKTIKDALKDLANKIEES